MITESDIIAFLRKVQSSPNETLIAYSTCFEGMVPGDTPERKWQDVSAADAAVMRATIRMGLVTGEFRRWEPDSFEEFVPDGGNYDITLSGSGVEKLLKADEPMIRRGLRQVGENIPTIITSVISAVVISFVLQLIGKSQ